MSLNIDEPGVYDLSDADYQSDPCAEISLRSSLAWRLIDKGSTPAHAAHNCARLNPDYEPEQKPAFDLGKAAHRLLLGKGSDYAIVHHNDYRKRKARDERAGIRAAGKVPLKQDEAAQVRAMASAATRQIQALIDAGTIEKSPFDGVNTERVIVWRDNGVLCRAMLDGLSIDGDIVSEFKTEGQSADKELWQWKARKLGYIFRLAFYRRGLEALKLAYSPSFHVFVQEIAAPHLLAFYRIDDELIAREDERVRRALKIWRRCLERNEWPGYPVEGFDLGLTEREQMEVAHTAAGKIAGGHLSSEDIAAQL